MIGTEADALPARAFDAFVAAEYDQLVRATSLIVGDRWVAQELVQDALGKAWVRWDRVGCMAAPGGWVQRVASNGARSVFRRRAAERRALRRHGVEPPTAPVESATVLAVREALLALPHRQREAVVHRYYLGRTVAETAEVLGVSQGATTQLTYRASQRLRELLRPDDIPIIATTKESGRA